MPDATSEIALGPDLWYVGCRNGLLYAFGFDGRQRWTWETPGSKGYEENAYFRPCPYFVASQQSFAVVASMGNVYAVAPNGKTLWHAALPNERQTRWEFTIPLQGGRGNEEPYGILGLPLNAPRDQVKSAYRRLALATHPDRNPGRQHCGRQVPTDPRRLRKNPRRSTCERSSPRRNHSEHRDSRLRSHC